MNPKLLWSNRIFFLFVLLFGICGFLASGPRGKLLGPPKQVVTINNYFFCDEHFQAMGKRNLEQVNLIEFSNGPELGICIDLVTNTEATVGGFWFEKLEDGQPAISGEYIWLNTSVVRFSLRGHVSPDPGDYYFVLLHGHNELLRAEFSIVGQ